MRVVESQRVLESELAGSVLTEDRIARLRQRIASGYYEQPHVLEAVARAIIKACPRYSWVARPDSSGRI